MIDLASRMLDIILLFEFDLLFFVVVTLTVSMIRTIVPVVSSTLVMTVVMSMWIWVVSSFTFFLHGFDFLAKSRNIAPKNYLLSTCELTERDLDIIRKWKRHVKQYGVD
jgi:hypothetical protein